MAKSNGSGWDWSESLAERMRMQKNGNAVRWYVLTLPVSRRYMKWFTQQGTSLD